MARGWESKSVEAQKELAEDRDSAPKNRLTPAQIELQRKKANLLLSRDRIVQQLQADLNPRHREMLRNALADLEGQLTRLH